MGKLTKEELAEIAAADAEIERGFRLTQEEIFASRERDRKAKLANADNQELRAMEYRRAYQRAYYEANKDAIKECNRAYREANKDAIKERRKRKNT